MQRNLISAAAGITLLAAAAAAAAETATMPQHLTAAAVAYDPAGTVRSEVTGTVQRLFDAMGRGDAALLRSVMDPAVVMHYAAVRDGETTFGTVTTAELADRITTSAAPLIERMWNPLVLIDGPLATVWTPYDFYVGERFSHCGIDHVNLLRDETGWRIVGLTWTRLQPPACALHPDGPPAVAEYR